MKIVFGLNGKEMSLETDLNRRLLDILREDASLSGVKEGCGEGECGACSVLMDGKLVNSCLIPAGSIAGAEIITIEGVRDTPEGAIIVESYSDSGAVQCGFCTPGMVMAAFALLRENNDPDEQEIREAISGNLCRCTGYTMIVKGVQLAAQRGREAQLW